MSDPPGGPSGSLSWAASIVDYRSDPDEVTAAIAALCAQTLAPTVVRVTVAENDVGGGRTAELRRRLPSDPSIELVPHLGNPGFAGGHNRAMERLFAADDPPVDVVLVHNPDLVLAADAAAWLVSAAACDGAMCGPVLELGDGGMRTARLDTAGVAWTWDGRHFDVGQGQRLPGIDQPVRRVDAVSGACIAISRAAHDCIVAGSGELFDEDFIAYREDAELGFRADLLGVASLVVPQARGVHSRRIRGTVRGADPAIDRLGVRNRFLIAFKYGRRRPGSGPGPWIRDAVVLLGVAVRERSSWPGVVEAWRLRTRMRAKGARVLASARRLPK